MYYEYKNVRPDGAHIDDCHIRAVVLAADMSYDDAEILFIKKQIELRAKHTNSKEVVFAVLQDLGFTKIETISQKTGRGTMKLSSFLRKNKEKYILYTRNHICYAEKGIVKDTWDCTGCLLCGYYKIERTNHE